MSAATLVKPGDIVCRGNFHTRYVIVSVSEDSPENALVRMKSTKSGRTETERLHRLRWPGEAPGQEAKPIVSSAREVDRASGASASWALCNNCGSAHRTPNTALNWWWCAGCQRTTSHHHVGKADDFAERDNEAHNKALRLLHATEQMLDTLGIDLRRRPMPEAAKMQAMRSEVGRRWLIVLADDLTVPEQVEYLGRAWRYLAPVNEERWVTGNWRRGTAGTEYCSLIWDRERNQP